MNKPKVFISHISEKRLLADLIKTQINKDFLAVSPVTAAAAINSPVLLIHGAADSETPPEHSKRGLLGPTCVSETTRRSRVNGSH